MKLRDKRTGETVNAMEVDLYTDVVYLKISKDCGYDSIEYDSLAEFNAEWEDVPEEPKEYWYIDWNGEVCRSDIHDERTGQMKLIGNYFENTRRSRESSGKAQGLGTVER